MFHACYRGGITEPIVITGMLTGTLSNGVGNFSTLSTTELILTIYFASGKCFFLDGVYLLLTNCLISGCQNVSLTLDKNDFTLT